MSLFSPAKINLFLRIVRRRPDNYHDLASLFHTVAFGDTLDMEILPDSATKDELKCNLPNVPTDESNLVVKALNLFRKRSGEKQFFRMNLVKSTPAQAGMGGGSSNAAAAFFGANKLCGSPASIEDLIEWTADPIIGSDATFFLSQGAAYCTGRGEIITPVAQLPISEKLTINLVKPNYGLSTPKVFKALDLGGLSEVAPEELLGAFQTQGADHGLWVNDLEKPAFVVEPNLGELKAFMAGDRFGFKAVLMSGSGTTIYGLGDPKCGQAEFEAAVKAKFDIELVQKTHLMGRPSPGEWYADPNA